MSKARSIYGGGTVYEQGKSFVAQLNYSVEIEGKVYSKRITGSGKTAAAATRKRNKNAKKWEEELRKSLLQPPEAVSEHSPSLNEVFFMNLKLKDSGVQASTSDNYEMYYKGYVETHSLGETAIADITEEQLLEFYTYTRLYGRKRVAKDKNGVTKEQKPLSVSTINHIRFVLFSTFQYAAAKGLINNNPHMNIKPFKSSTAAMLDFTQDDLDADSDDLDALERVIPLDELDRILKYAFQHSRLAGLFAWAVNSGMREGECLGLKHLLANPQNSYIMVKRSLAYIKNRANDKKGKVPKLKLPKNGKERKVPYNSTLEAIYSYQMGLIKREKQEAGKAYHDKGLLFADEYGDYLRPWKVLKEFQKILEAANVPRHRFHDMRHTFVSILVKECQKSGDGISILDVSKIVGHADPTITLKIYGGLFPNSTEKAMQILDRSGVIKLPIADDKERQKLVG